MKTFLRQFRAWYVRHERAARAGAFAAGFLFDALTLPRIDLGYATLVLSAYLAIAAGGILLTAILAAGRLRLPATPRFLEWLELAVLFSFGNLMSGYAVLYAVSASFADSWPFLAMLLALFVGNELFRTFHRFLLFQLGMLFVALFSYLAFSLPILLSSIGTGVFLLSGALSLALFAAFAKLLERVDRARLRAMRRNLALTAAVIYTLFNVAYFGNLIPPIPLALRDIGVYHRVLTGTDGYTLVYEPAPWYLRFFSRTDSVYHRAEEEPVYVFSAIFAPTKLRTTIFHEWSRLDEEADAWVPRFRISFPIIGGRDGGYRGYSLAERVEPGRWRVAVAAERGQVIGRISFTVVPAAAAPALVTRVE